MRTAGFVVILIGGLIIYLGISGKMGAFFTALTTGKVPLKSNTSNNANQTNPVTNLLLKNLYTAYPNLKAR